MKFTIALLLLLTFVITFAFKDNRLPAAGELSGAWKMDGSRETQVILFIDGYFTHSSYDNITKKFIQTRGGSYTFNDNKLVVSYEFDSRLKEQIGQSAHYNASLIGNKLTADIVSAGQTWTRIDEGNVNLAGLWKITARKQGDTLQPIHQTGTRKTVKILTSTRFQWAAIDPGTKSFMGTGGGTYTFKDGKYTENIEFFSRDSSRVGASLTFDGKLQNGDWHHSGPSSRGEPIYEVWSRKK